MIRIWIVKQRFVSVLLRPTPPGDVSRPRFRTIRRPNAGAYATASSNAAREAIFSAINLMSGANMHWQNGVERLWFGSRLLVTGAQLQC